MLSWVALTCCVAPLALAGVGAAWWLWTRRGSRTLRDRAGELGIVPGVLPSPKERALHLPRDEAELRARCPGEDVERIVALYRHGELARAVVLELGTTEHRLDAVSTRVEFWHHYGWYDAAGQFHVRRSDQPGLLNRELLPRGPGETFLVAFDRASRDHVVFFGAGLPPPVDAPPALAPRPRPAEPQRAPLPPEALEQADALVRTIIERSDDEPVVRVAVDRLLELGDLRGEFMALQLDRAPGAPPSERERALVPQLLGAWKPLGGEVLRFERGLPTEVLWDGPARAKDLAWAAAERIDCRAPFSTVGTPFDQAQPRLRAVTGLRTLPPAALWARIAPRLEQVSVEAAEEAWLTAFGALLAQATGLRAFGLTLAGRQLPETLRVVLSLPLPPKLEVVELSDWSVRREELLDAQARLRERGVSWVLDVDVLGALGSASTRAWVRVSREGLAVRTRGQPTANDLVRAKRLVDG